MSTLFREKPLRNTRQGNQEATAAYPDFSFLTVDFAPSLPSDNEILIFARSFPLEIFDIQGFCPCDYGQASKNLMPARTNLLFKIGNIDLCPYFVRNSYSKKTIYACFARIFQELRRSGDAPACSMYCHFPFFCVSSPEISSSICATVFPLSGCLFQGAICARGFNTKSLLCISTWGICKVSVSITRSS